MAIALAPCKAASGVRTERSEAVSLGSPSVLPFEKAPQRMNDLNFAATWFTTMTLLGVPLTNWALACAAALGFYLLFTFGLRFALRRASRVAVNTSNRVDDTLIEVLSRTNRWLLALAALLIGLSL
ncbi:MAG: hypothetical protein H0W38_15290, partial [Methylibium sp.]|nr:hypothetical protein [Methylibium sp.]